MIRRFAPFFAVFLSIQPLHAQTIEVLSGEHGDFSRLVMQFPKTVDWVFGRSDQGYEFRVPDTGYTFDIDRVFQRIPRARIQTVETQGAALSLVVSERFHADVFELREGRLVIDIKDGAPSASSPYENPIPGKVTEGQDQSPLPESSLMSDGAGDQKLGRTYADQISVTESAPLSLPLVPSRASGEVSAQVVDLEEELADGSSQFDDLEQQLIEQIGRAVSQGMLEPDVRKTEKIVDEARAHIEATAEPDLPSGPTPMPEPEEAAALQSHMRIQSSVPQKADREIRTSERIDSYGTLCLEGDVLDISTWGQPLEEGLQISDYRVATVGEFDEPREDGVRDLAKYYLYLTFGAETRSVLMNFNLNSNEDTLLHAIADVMDLGYAPDPGALNTQFRCDGPSAFWSAMAKREFSPSEELNLDSILATFSALPLHMRRHLGPTLSERFLAAGDAQTAKSIQNTIARAEGDHGDAFDLLDAELSMMEGDRHGAESELEQLITDDGPEAAKALVKLIEHQVAQDQSVEKRLAEAAEAMLVEYRGNEFEVRLQDAAILARLYSGDVDLALKRSLQRGLKQDEDFIAQALGVLNAQESDAEFSKVILGNLAGVSQVHIPEAERMSTVSRLMNLGFYQEVLKLMAGSAQKDDDASRLILARAFYGLGEMDTALRYASQIDTAEAAEIVSKAYFYKNEPDRALTISQDAGLTDQTATYALTAEDWESLASADAGALSILAEAVAGRDPQSAYKPNSQETLEQLRDDLTESQKLRTALESIVN